MINNTDFKECVIANVNGTILAGVLLPEINDERTNLKFRIFRELLNGNEYIVFDDIKYHEIIYYLDEIELHRFARDFLSESEKLGVIARAIKYEQEKLYKEEQENIKKLIK